MRIFLLALIAILLTPGFAFSQGVVNPYSGEYYPGSVGGGAINPRSGEYYPGTGDGGAINPHTGTYYPGTGRGGTTDYQTGQPNDRGSMSLQNKRNFDLR